MDRTEHWDRSYERRSPREVSRYERTPTISIRRVREAVDGGARTLLDVGAGASMLVDEALELGLRRIAVLDISERALNASAERLGSKADRIEWIVGDVTAIEDVGMFDVWHDRAVFHFLTDASDQERYVSLCERTVAPGGIAIVATFAPDGPGDVQRPAGTEVRRIRTRCSMWSAVRAPRFRAICPSDASRSRAEVNVRVVPARV
jgi:SAM-dependent methyltransferase